MPEKITVPELVEDPIGVKMVLFGFDVSTQMEVCVVRLVFNAVSVPYTRTVVNPGNAFVKDIDHWVIPETGIQICPVLADTDWTEKLSNACPEIVKLDET